LLKRSIGFFGRALASTHKAMLRLVGLSIATPPQELSALSLQRGFHCNPSRKQQQQTKWNS
jgi:hypothetical protein